MYLHLLMELALFQSTLSVRRATHRRPSHQTHHTISIHALRKESDVDGPSTVTGHAVFQSTLSVRRATRMLGLDHVEVTQVFQSTLSVRRATHQLCQLSKTIEVFQSTLSVRRATRVNVPVNIGGTISSHALRKESDVQLYGHHGLAIEFQSTLSIRRATRAGLVERTCGKISIHALRKESD